MSQTMSQTISLDDKIASIKTAWEAQAPHCLVAVRRHEDGFAVVALVAADNVMGFVLYSDNHDPAFSVEQIIARGRFMLIDGRPAPDLGAANLPPEFESLAIGVRHFCGSASPTVQA